jgi:hypothetical protein
MTMTRKELETLVWKKTHRDFRGTQVRKHGRRVLHFVSGQGTCLVPLSSLTDEELQQKAGLK